MGNIVYSSFDTLMYKINLSQKIDSNMLNQEISKEDLNNVEEELKEKNVKQNSWYVEIPSINLIANISEGTSQETMNKFVGHFEETSKLNGNIGLAAHNRGYENNYFSGLKKLKEGDKILYTYENCTKEYQVTNHLIIENTNWTYLENTEENIITLITCVENEPKYRRCVQAEEI